MGCICPKAASANDVTETPKAKASSKAQIRHFNGSARIETIEALNNFLVEKDREKFKPRTKQNDGRQDSMDRRRRQYAVSNPRLGNVPEQIKGEQVAAGWPAWFTDVAGEAIKGWIPRRADSFEKLDKIGQGTYSNVYKARDLSTGKIVALKKVRFDSSEPESVKFMAREIKILRRLDHPNVVKLEGLVTSRMSSSLYLVFEYMEHDLAGLAACPGIMFTEPQVKCYLQQLLRGLDHCHTRGVLHRDIKGSNLLIDNDGLLKIADFGLATFYNPSHKIPMTSRVVTLWYRPPELLLGATDYGVGVDLWSTGCILAELLAGKPIMPGRTEVEQLHRIFKLCGSPSEAYWKRLKLPDATLFKPQQFYKRSLAETFKDLPPAALALLETLLAIEPADRGVASAALKSDFFTTKPYPCDPQLLPKYPPSKELDSKVREEEARRHRAGRSGAADPRRHGSRERSRAGPAPDANAELPLSLQKRRTHQASTKSKSEKFPCVSEKTATGFPMEPPPSRQGRLAIDIRASSPVPHRRVAPPSSRSGPLDAAANPAWTRKEREDDVRMAPPRAASRSMRVTTDSRHWQAGRREEEGDFTRQLRNTLKAEQQRKPELDTRRSDVLRGPQQLANVPDPQLTSKVDYDERMYYSGPLLRPGLSAAVDIEELLEEHERKLKQAVRRANQEHTSKPSSNSSGKHD